MLGRLEQEMLNDIMQKLGVEQYEKNKQLAKEKKLKMREEKEEKDRKRIERELRKNEQLEEKEAKRMAKLERRADKEGRASNKETRPKKRRKKDSDAPKQALSAYMCFAKEKRPHILNDTPGLAVTEVAKVLGARWREMGDDARAPFEELMRLDKQRYQKEMELYVSMRAAEEDTATVD